MPELVSDTKLFLAHFKKLYLKETSSFPAYKGTCDVVKRKSYKHEAF